MNHWAAVLALMVVVAAEPGTSHAEDWPKDGWLYAPLAGAVGGTLGAASGGLAGSLLDTCSFSTPNCTPAFTIAGLGAGLIIGTAAGVSWYGKRRGLRGSFRRAVVGALLGHLASGSVVVLTASTVDNGAIGFPLVIAAIVGMPAVGASIMYKRSMGSPVASSESRSPALVAVDQGKVAVQIPIVGVGVTASETVVLLPLAGGRF